MVSLDVVEKRKFSLCAGNRTPITHSTFTYDRLMLGITFIGILAFCKVNVLFRGFMLLMVDMVEIEFLCPRMNMCVHVSSEGEEDHKVR